MYLKNNKCIYKNFFNNYESNYKYLKKLFLTLIMYQ